MDGSSETSMKDDITTTAQNGKKPTVTFRQKPPWHRHGVLCARYVVARRGTRHVRDDVGAQGRTRQVYGVRGLKRRRACVRMTACALRACRRVCRANHALRNSAK